MRVPQFERYRRTVLAGAVFLIGMLAGAALFNTLYHYQLNALHSTIDGLSSMIEERDHDIRLLDEYKHQHTVIKTVHPYIEEIRTGSAAGSAIDTRTEAELKRRIKEDLSVFIGKSVYDIGSDARLARMLLDRKIYVGGAVDRRTGGVLEDDYIVTVRTMLVVDSTLTVWVEARVHKRD
ncbi:hypothetical protein IDH44_23995 [Paenibacillus sp. IB182496]|uniref:Sporulation membrane protein YtrI C-terminal domain-containing protein n=1 Tax=Paenibacillus sabuli TaxID=2772509 RepID=A0A927BZC1_9BACL|nr:hypothetical protein [Paenibacillus sabuli]MBD2848269.1 hypothetical protein [Paenibacillus sabuli]